MELDPKTNYQLNVQKSVRFHQNFPYYCTYYKQMLINGKWSQQPFPAINTEFQLYLINFWFKIHHVIFFQGIWYGILHHTVNEHQWMISYGDNVPNECQHGPLSSERDKGWLKGATPPHDALIKIVMDKHLLRKIPYYLHCRQPPIKINMKIYKC